MLPNPPCSNVHLTFTSAYPGNYYQVLQDNLAQITSGVFTPEAGAADLITQLNATIAGQ